MCFVKFVILTPPLTPRAKATVFALYAMAVRRVVGTIGHPLQAAQSHRRALMATALAEELAQQAGEAGHGGVGEATAAAAREALEPLPLGYVAFAVFFVMSAAFIAEPSALF